MGKLPEQIHVRHDAVLRLEAIPPVIGIIPFQAEAKRPVMEKVHAGTQIAVDEACTAVKQRTAAAILQIEARTVSNIFCAYLSKAIVTVHPKIYMRTCFPFGMVIQQAAFALDIDAAAAAEDFIDFGSNRRRVVQYKRQAESFGCLLCSAGLSSYLPWNGPRGQSGL